MVRAVAELRRQPRRAEIVPLMLLPISVAVTVVMFATDIGGAVGARLLDQPSLLLPTVLSFLALAGVLCLRRSYPVLTYAASVVVTSFLMVLLQSVSLALSPLYWFAAVALGMRVQGVRLVSAVVAGVTVDALVSASVRAVSLDGGDADFAAHVLVSLFNATITTVALVLLGSVIAMHRRQVESGRMDLELERLEHESRTARALEAERASMARELHDVAAHHLAGMLIQAKNAERLMTRDPDTARALLSGVIGQGHRTLDGLRQIVGILRTPGGESVSPQPSVADIESLVDGFRAMFADVTVTMCGDTSDLDSGVQLACYRIVQESLSNASRYAHGSQVAVRVERADSDIVVSVINDVGDGSGDSDGHVRGLGLGLVGMRERVALHGGSVDAGALDGGWSVRARVPVHGRISA